jgi:hypothetical protein
MTEIVSKTNGERLEPLLRAARGQVQAVVKWAHDNPDEVLILVTPVVMTALATRRHNLGFAETMLISEVSYWCGILAVKAYRDWKAKPSSPALKLVV